MIYSSKEGEIDLSKVTRLYPAAVIEVNKQVAEMSLEWMESNEGKVKLLHYVLVFDFTPKGQELRDKKVLEYQSKNELFEAMEELSKLFES